MVEGAVAGRVKLAVLIVLWLAAAIAILHQGWLAVEIWFRDPHIEQSARLFARNDVDQAVFLKDIGAHSGPLGPLFWWHNGWHGTAYPNYWRPLTMLGFWTEYHLFGPYRFDRWQVADIFFHLIFAGVLGVFAYRVTGSRFAAPLTVLVLANSYADLGSLSFSATYFTTPDGNVILGNWKDQPEAWGAASTVASLIAGLNRRWWWALGFAVVSICFKESGWLTFPMLLATFLYTGTLREIPRAAWIGTAISWIVLVAMRASAGRAVMSPVHDLNNHFPLVRYMRHVLDPNVQQLGTDRWAVVVFGAVTVCLLFWKRVPFLVRFLLIVVVGAVSAVMLGLANRTDPASGLAMLVDPGIGLGQMKMVVIETAALLLAWRYRPVRRQALYLYSLVLLSDLPEMAVLQPNSHMLYFTNGLQCVLVVAIGMAAARSVVEAYKSRRLTRTTAVSTA